MGENLNKGQSSNEARCIRILIDKDEYKEQIITLASQLDCESTTYILEACLKAIKEKTSLNGSTNWKGK